MTEQLTQIKKKQISAEIIADSTSPQGHRLTTFVVTFPRIVLSEFNTHRMFSRNSASSRAIPFEKMVKMVQEDPFIPIAWQKEHSGMQGTEYFTEELIPHKSQLSGDYVNVERLKKEWLEARDEAVNNAINLSNCGVTKQLVNRLLEPFMWHTAIITTHEIENFFALRCPQYEMQTSYGKQYFRSRKDYLKQVGLPDEEKNYDAWTDLDWLKINKGGAEIHISLLSEKMWDAYNESKPKQLKAGEWHIPFGSGITNVKLSEQFGRTIKREEGLELSLKIASARCARVSYINYEGKDDYKADLKLFDRLVVAEPIHASPVEHCARAMSQEEYESNVRGLQKSSAGVKWAAEDIQGWSGNFRGFIQYRKMFANENKV